VTVPLSVAGRVSVLVNFPGNQCNQAHALFAGDVSDLWPAWRTPVAITVTQH
jgi:hypothetical protein